MLHKPTRGFGAEENPDSENEGRDEGRSKLQAPGDSTGVFDNHIGTEPQEYA